MLQMCKERAQGLTRGIDRGFRKVARSLDIFRRNTRGNVAMIFGLAVIPMVTAAGVGIDLSRAYMVKQRLGHALDAAALAVGTATDKSGDELDVLAQSYFDANYPAAELGVPGALTLTVSDGVISMAATAKVDTAMMNIAGYDELNVSASTEVTRKITGLEVVMVLDNTGSMGSYSKLTTLKTAANDLVDILFGDETSSENLKIGLVPFAAAVNVGTEHLTSGWIDTTGASSVNGLNFYDGEHALQVYNMMSNKSWNGCVEARPAPYDIQDTTPDVSNGDTLWVPYLAPDEPDIGSYYGYYYPSSYLYDSSSSNNLQKRQAKTGKYSSYVYSSGPHINCSTKPITPLTGTKATVTSAISAMNATGTTNIPFGMAWGWRVISPSSPFTEGSAYDDEKFQKVIILLTDGENYIGSYYNHNKSYYNAYGYVKDGRLGTTSSGSALTELNERTSQVCENIKDENPDKPIIVYTITFQLYDDDIKDIMRGCASDPEKFFDSPSNSVLKQNFQTIANELSELRISR